MTSWRPAAQLRRQTAERAKAEEGLRRAQKLEAADPRAGGMAREFANLLQAIEGHTAYAMVGLSPHEKRYQDLRQVLNASSRAATLARQWLGFSPAIDARRGDETSTEGQTWPVPV